MLDWSTIELGDVGGIRVASRGLVVHLLAVRARRPCCRRAPYRRRRPRRRRGRALMAVATIGESGRSPAGSGCPGPGCPARWRPCWRLRCCSSSSMLADVGLVDEARLRHRTGRGRDAGSPTRVRVGLRRRRGSRRSSRGVTRRRARCAPCSRYRSWHRCAAIAVASPAFARAKAPSAPAQPPTASAPAPWMVPLPWKPPIWAFVPELARAKLPYESTSALLVWMIPATPNPRRR